jgi:chromosome segregation ATPase
MKLQSARRFGAALLALLLVALLVLDAFAQQRRTRPSRRTTNPVRPRAVAPAPTPLPSGAETSEPTLVHSAEDVAAQEDETPVRRKTTRRAAREQEQPSETEELRKTVTTLSQTVTKLSDELTSLKGEQRTLVDLERLTRAEQRAESLRAQLRDVTDKEFTFQDRLAQIEQELQPDAIERRSALIGSLNPSAVREQIRLSLERERDRIQRQLEMLAQSHARLDTAVASADQEVERIRARIDAAEQQSNEVNAGAGQASQPAPTPNPPGEPPR